MAAKRGSEALLGALSSVDQTRILFVLDFAWRLFWGLIVAHPFRLKLSVPYTVIRAHSSMGGTFALSSDYLEDFYSFFLQ